LPPLSPKLNGSAERSNRTHTEEFYEVTDAEPELASLQAALARWELVYNTVRLHQAVGYLTPAEFLASFNEDLVEFVRGAKGDDGPELRTLGSLSVIRQLLVSGWVDGLKLVICPLVLGETGIETLFAGLPDIGFELPSTRIFDKRVLLVEYRPAGRPPYAS
jgi:hypothetical protein